MMNLLKVKQWIFWI